MKRLALVLVLFLSMRLCALAQVQATFSENFINGSPSTILWTLTTLNALGSGQVSASNAGSATTGIVGIARTGVLPSNGLVSIVYTGLTYCVFDTTTVTQLDYITVAGSGGKCHDIGASYPSSGQVIGRIIGVKLATSTFQIHLYPPEIRSGGGGGGAGVPAGSLGQPQYYAGSTTFGGSGAVLYVDGFAGATWDAKVTNCIAALPASGGTCDARGLTGTQSLVNNLALTNGGGSITLLLGPMSLTCTAGKQIQFYADNQIIGLHFDKTKIFAGSSTSCLAPGAAGPANVLMQDFTISNTQNGAVALELGDMVAGTVTRVHTEESGTGATSIGTHLGSTGNCACYNLFTNDVFIEDSDGHALDLEQTGSQNTFIGGSYNAGHNGGSAGVGVYIAMAGNHFYDPDSEHGGGGTAPIAFEITGSANAGNEIYGGYYEGVVPLQLDSGANNNWFTGASPAGMSQVAIADNSGNLSNYHKFLGSAGTGTVGLWPLYDNVLTGYFFGSSIQGAGGTNYSFALGNPGLDMSYAYQLNASYGYMGHAPLEIGQSLNSSGQDVTGSIQTAALRPGSVATPVASVIGTPGSTSYTFCVVCIDSNNNKSTDSPCSNTVTTGNATLTGLNYIKLTWANDDGCELWDITNSGNTLSYALNQRVPAYLTGCTGGGTVPVSCQSHEYDVQSNTTAAYTMPARDMTGDMRIGFTRSGFLTGANHGGFSAGNVTIPADGTVYTAAGEGTAPAHLATFGTCNAGHEGLYATQDDSAVACVAGILAAAGGTTHCAIYCNGSQWSRTGL